MAAALGTLLGTAAMISPGAQAAPRETAALRPPALSAPAPARLHITDLPPVLSSSDVLLHQRIQAAQAGGDWTTADKLMGDLGDKRLLGYLLAERYLSPRFKPSYGDLVSWLTSYGDLVDAGRIHALAVKLHPAKAPMPPAPAPVPAIAGAGGGQEDAGWHGSHTVPSPVKAASKGKKGQAAAAPASAPSPAADNPGVARSNPHAAWTAGLAAWRAGKHDQALRYFEAVATSPASSSWNAAAGAFWAARASLVTRKPEAFNRWMARAAESPYTFYGMMARRALGQDINIDWSLPALGKPELARLESYPGALRAIALIQVGDRNRAEEELRRTYPRLPVDLAPLGLTIAERGGMPALAMRIAGRMLHVSGVRYDAGLYPLPSWTPPGGYTLNRALLFALARIESGFNPAARNPSGASGLMQLMPATARNMSGGGHTDVFDPEHNLGMGQRYVESLLRHDRVRGNLLSLVAGYNVGPGNLTPTPGEDPLLLIESMSSGETRSLVQRVLTNFWLYQLRLGQPIESLDAIAQGDMPLYIGSHVGDTALAQRNGRN